MRSNLDHQSEDALGHIGKPQLVCDIGHVGSAQCVDTIEPRWQFQNHRRSQRRPRQLGHVRSRP